MNIPTLICKWLLVIINCLFEVSTTQYWGFAFISVRYTITDIQTCENLLYIIRGAKWGDVKNVLSSSSKFDKWILGET